MASAFSVPKAKKVTFPNLEKKYSGIQVLDNISKSPEKQSRKQSQARQAFRPLYSFGKEGRKSQQNLVPRPGAYEPKEHCVI